MTLTTHPLLSEEITTSEISKSVDFAHFFSLTFSSAYYNQPDFQTCRFDFKPTDYTQKFLNNQGLLYRPKPAGLNVGMSLEQRDALIRTLKAGAKDEREWIADHLQEWMSFTFTAIDADFGNYTNLSPAFDPKTEALYFSNAHARRVRHDGARARRAGFRTRSDRANEANLDPALAKGDAQIVPKVGPIEQYDFPEDCEKIEVLNIVDEVVLCYPRKLPLKLLNTAPPEHIDCEQASEYQARNPGEPEAERSSCFILFGSVRAGLYRIRYVGSAHADETRIYPGNASNCLGFVDIQLADPGLSLEGVYPISNLFGPGGAEFCYVDYTSRFGVRKTHWNYVIIPRPGEALLTAEFLDPDGIPIDFDPGRPVAVPQAPNAQLFRSVHRFAFQSKPDFWLTLRGSLEDRDGIFSSETVLVSAMPVPTPLQLSNDKKSHALISQRDFRRGAKSKSASSDEMSSFVYLYL